MEDELLSLFQSPAVLIDAGAREWRCGFSEDDGPAVVLPGPRLGGGFSAWCAQLKQAFDELEVTPSEHAVVLSETPGTSAAAREAMAAAVLTDHGAGALWIVASPLLALFNSGRDTGVIVDVGESATYILMVYDGRPLAHAAVHPLAGGHAPNSGPDAACDVLFEPTLLAGIADGGEDGGGGNGEGGRGAGGATHGGSVSSGAPLRTAATIGVHEAVLRTIAVAGS